MSWFFKHVKIHVMPSNEFISFQILVVSDINKKSRMFYIFICHCPLICRSIGVIHVSMENAIFSMESSNH